MGSGNTTNLISTIVPKPCSHCSQISIAAILEAQNFCQKLQALSIIKIQISIHQKKALSELIWSITTDCCKLVLELISF